MSGVKTFGPPTIPETKRVSDRIPPIGDYIGEDARNGYSPTHVDPAVPLPMPGVGAWGGDVVDLLPAARETGRDDQEIRYTNFSVKMCKSRKLPLFSACNIDGAKMQRDIERTDVWIRDPRIDAQYQVHRQGYGNDHQGFFSRGHMTRREDPNWGSVETATQADADTFHVTNVAPQRQGFNAGIWLHLENYVLDNTDRENMRVTVITGPLLRKDDPIYYEVKVPVQFWKVLAFVHADTKEVATIGYCRSQANYLPSARGARFVFGNFDDTQVSIAWIERETGLDFSAYRDLDVLAGAGADVEIALTSVLDLYLRR